MFNKIIIKKTKKIIKSKKIAVKSIENINIKIEKKSLIMKLLITPKLRINAFLRYYENI